MFCRLCSPAQALHQSLLDHVLAEHPTARLAAGLGLAVGTVALARRPSHLVALYGVVMIGALLVAAPGRSA